MCAIYRVADARIEIYSGIARFPFDNMALVYRQTDRQTDNYVVIIPLRNRLTIAYIVTWQYEEVLETLEDVNSVIDHVACWVDQSVLCVSPRVIDQCCNVNALNVLRALRDANSHVAPRAVIRNCNNTSNIITGCAIAQALC